MVSSRKVLLRSLGSYEGHGVFNHSDTRVGTGKRNSMKKQSRIITLLLVGTLGLTPFFSMGIRQRTPLKERVKGAMPGEELSGVIEIKELGKKGKEFWQTGETRVELGEVTIDQKGAALVAISAAAILAAIVGTIVRKVRVQREVNKLRTIFPTYPIYALELAAVAKLVGFKRWIVLMHVQNIAKFRNPKREISLLAMDGRLVDAISYATNYRPEYVRRVLENPGLLRMLKPF